MNNQIRASPQIKPLSRPKFDNYVTATSHCQNQWNFHSSFFFAGTVATTIGYGHMVPQTAEGRSFLLIFMLFGIPFFAMLTQSISSEINIHVLQRKKERGSFTPNCSNNFIFQNIPRYMFWACASLV